MLYTTEVKSESIPHLFELRNKFDEIYDEHGIDVMGYWQREDKPNVTYMMTRYSSDDDYKSKIEKLRADERYMKLTHELEQIRTGFEAKRLNPA
ncbi:MAG: hypothetical protein ACFFD3_14690 [Candidatus Thorarchaeota archaeon]